MPAAITNKPNRKFVVSDADVTVYWEWTQTTTDQKIKQVQVSAFKNGHNPEIYTVKPGTKITVCKEDLRTKTGFSIKPAIISQIFLKEGALYVTASQGKSSMTCPVGAVNSFS